MLPSKRGGDDLARFSADNKRTCSGEEASDMLISGPLVLPFSSCFFLIYGSI
jgi:hypothetical protein